MWMGDRERRKIRNDFFDSFYISFQFLPIFSWFRPLRGEGGVGKNTKGLKTFKKVKLDSRRPFNVKLSILMDIVNKW